MALRGRTHPLGGDLWAQVEDPRSLMVRQRLLASRLPAGRSASVIALPVGPGVDGARVAHRLLERSDAA